jgi:L-fuconate dehydratase
MGGISEVIVLLLMAAKAKKPVCLHAGGVGLCEMGIHLPIFDYIAVSAAHEDRFFEYSGALHEHFKHPINIVNGHF